VGSNRGHQMTSARIFPTEHLSVQDPTTDRSSVSQLKFSNRKRKPVTTGATFHLHKWHINHFHQHSGSSRQENTSKLHRTELINHLPFQKLKK
jgi:hypothetical protein